MPKSVDVQCRTSPRASYNAIARYRACGSAASRLATQPGATSMTCSLSTDARMVVWPVSIELAGDTAHTETYFTALHRFGAVPVLLLLDCVPKLACACDVHPR